MQKSCLDTIISLTEKIKQCVDENKIVTLFLDLAKAFKPTSIVVFMNILKRYGIEENAGNLINSFLCDRKQCGIAKSDWVVINHGVPQGTLLEPLIFVLYVNNFGEAVLTNCDVLQFADDRAILCHAKNNKFAANSRRYIKQDRSIYETKHVNLE